jgi:hypothetical protein
MKNRRRYKQMPRRRSMVLPHEAGTKNLAHRAPAIRKEKRVIRYTAVSMIDRLYIIAGTYSTSLLRK